MATEPEKLQLVTPSDTLHPDAPPAPISEHTVLLQVIARAAGDPTLDLGRMERLLVMYERLNTRKAEQEFVQAMAEFKGNPPRILKSKRVAFESERTGGTTEYYHATLGDVCDAAIEGLAKVGISHRWDLEQNEGRVIVTCVLTHRGGHSTRTTLNGAPDSSGKKNPVQQVASTVTYLERYTLLAATGLATQEDEDARAPEQPAPQIEPPAGYEKWKADMTAKADEGLEKLTASWQKTDALVRAYATLDGTWWNDLKRRAGKVAA